MHQPASIPIRLAPHDAHPVGLKAEGLSEADDSLIRGAPGQRSTVDLGVTQPLGARAAVGAKESQGPGVDVKAVAIVTVYCHQSEANLAITTDSKKVFCDGAGVGQQVLEVRWVQPLILQQCGHIAGEGPLRGSVAAVGELAGLKGCHLVRNIGLRCSLPQAQVYAGVLNVTKDFWLRSHYMGRAHISSGE